MTSAHLPASFWGLTSRPARLAATLVLLLLAAVLSLVLAVTARTAKPIVFYGAAAPASVTHPSPNKPIVFW